MAAVISIQCHSSATALYGRSIAAPQVRKMPPRNPRLCNRSTNTPHSGAHAKGQEPHFCTSDQFRLLTAALYPDHVPNSQNPISAESSTNDANSRSAAPLSSPRISPRDSTPCTTSPSNHHQITSLPQDRWVGVPPRTHSPACAHPARLLVCL